MLTTDRTRPRDFLEELADIAADARREREWAREHVKQGTNPTHAKEIDRLRRLGEAANTYETVAVEWIEQNRGNWSPTYLRQVEIFLRKDVFPKIGALPIRMVTAAHLLGIIREVEAREAQSIAVLIRQWSGQIFRYAVATLRADSDPSRKNLKKSLTVCALRV